MKKKENNSDDFSKLHLLTGEDFLFFFARGRKNKKMCTTLSLSLSPPSRGDLDVSQS